MHGAVLPPHVLIEPEEHGLTLVDWCYATGGPRPGTLPAIPARYRDWYPPEVRPGYVPGPDLDIYLAALCMLRLLAGQQTPEPLAAFAAGCLLANPRRRPDDAWALLREFDEIPSGCTARAGSGLSHHGSPGHAHAPSPPSTPPTQRPKAPRPPASATTTTAT